MADTAGYPTDASKQGMGAHADSVHTSNKRKRDTRDQGPTTSRPAPHNNDLTDQATASYLAAHNASTNDEDMQQFNLHQDGASTQNVNDTAAAALAYSHQMTVPTATELSFQPQSTGDGSSFGMGDHHQPQQAGMADFSLEALKAVTSTPRTGQAPGNESPPNTSGHKPPVGSDEWHKVRRDNHKEGTFTTIIFLNQHSSY
jgi:bHLH factor